jgi:hypothetical protein
MGIDRQPEMIRRPAMSDPKHLIEQLRQSNRRWKTIALAACSVLVLAVLFGMVGVTRQQYQVEAQRRETMAAVARAASLRQAK